DRNGGGLVRPECSAEDHDGQDGGCAQCEPSCVGADVARLGAVGDRAETPGRCGCNAAGTIDDAAVDQAAKDEAGEHKQRRDDEGGVEFVDVELVVDKAVEAWGALSEAGGGARLPVVEEECDIE